MNFLQILLGQLPEAIYFAIFMILTKKLTNKRLLYIVLMCLDYVLLFNIFPFNVWSHFLFFIMAFIILKLLYKERAQVTDVFTMGIASLLIILISIPVYFIVSIFTTDTIIGNVIQKVVLFLVLFLLRNKLPKIQNIYKKFWNRNDKVPKRMKSTTFRALNVVLFNLMFYLINFGMITVIILTNWR